MKNISDEILARSCESVTKMKDNFFKLTSNLIKVTLQVTFNFEVVLNLKHAKLAKHVLVMLHIYSKTFFFI